MPCLLQLAVVHTGICKSFPEQSQKRWVAIDRRTQSVLWCKVSRNFSHISFLHIWVLDVTVFKFYISVVAKCFSKPWIPRAEFCIICYCRDNLEYFPRSVFLNTPKNTTIVIIQLIFPEVSFWTLQRMTGAILLLIEPMLVMRVTNVTFIPASPIRLR
jgi:hypothetical protein